MPPACRAKALRVIGRTPSLPVAALVLFSPRASMRKERKGPSRLSFPPERACVPRRETMHIHHRNVRRLSRLSPFWLVCRRRSTERSFAALRMTAWRERLSPVAPRFIVGERRVWTAEIRQWCRVSAARFCHRPSSAKADCWSPPNRFGDR